MHEIGWDSYDRSMLRFLRVPLIPRLCLVALAFLLAGCGSHAPPAAANPFGRLVLGRSQRLTLRSQAGTEQTLVSTPPGSFPAWPAWSPDGSRIAYVQSIPFTGQTTADWGGDIYVLPAAGGTPQLIRQHSQAGDEVYGLAWTADGKSLLAGIHTTTFTNGAYAGATQHLERVDLTGGQGTVLVPNAVFPSVTHDGARMAYLTQNPETGEGGIWVSSIDGTDAHQLISYGDRFPAILSPRISPSGDAVAFSAPPGAPQADPTPAGRSIEPNILKDLLAALLPAPAAAHGLPMDIWRVSTVNAAVQQLTHVNEDDPSVAWSRDGSQIVFFATGGLYTVNSDGSGLKKIGQGEFNGNIDTEWAAAAGP
ncbi:MAG: hypothetical protein M3021_01560 [Actinomycetota bacterium]|nr:hypothetical protein [Actinomycetota bacterium]